MKPSEWMEAKPKLIEKYRKENIMTCEGRALNPECMRNWALNFHHLDRRSSGRAENTYKGTRLLCPHCHWRADQAPGHKEFNELLKKLR